MKNNGVQLQMECVGAMPNTIMVDIKNDIPMPLYKIGQVLDIRPNKNGAPNRVEINDIRLVVSGNSEWVYHCTFESDHMQYAITESALVGMVLPMTAQVYKSKTIRNRYKNGWRFYGNMTMLQAQHLGNQLATKDYIAHIRICEAYNSRGKLLTDGRVSLWIQYRNPINKEQIESNVNIVIK